MENFAGLGNFLLEAGVTILERRSVLRFGVETCAVAPVSVGGDLIAVPIIAACAVHGCAAPALAGRGGDGDNCAATDRDEALRRNIAEIVDGVIPTNVVLISVDIVEGAPRDVHGRILKVHH